ncbi:glucodextranase DOMON-like domain-containing protein [Stigmatella hybrida]|uniref:glucodextranase DOMON-like domain-containing protein n=1 Tax=Stigmatella hybrida TaxID=394097 RepID=UPI001CDAA3CD|nr:glucodextranase DOMON-like domain-containing protein [Stigmatella hybrida]
MPLPPGALEADEAIQTVSLTLPEALFQGLDSLQGVQVYVTTWDYDGGYRPLVATAEQWKFWGGDGATDPLVLDSTPVLVIP